MTAQPDVARRETPGAAVPPFRYTAALANEIEARWQDRWEAEGTFETPNPSGPLSDGETLDPAEKYYLMDMFPYPSGAGLHVGHPLGFIGTDVLGRFLRMTGRTVLHTMGFDAFGLPAEQYAVQTGTHPRTTTEANVERYRAQIRRLGLAHDKRRSVSTTDVEFYRWTQWIFLQIHGSWFDVAQDRARPITELETEFAAGTRALPDGRSWDALTRPEQDRVLDGHRLAYLADAPVNWCPALGTVLSNEEVTADGRSERGNFPVFRRNLRQWMMRITAYADRLADDLDGVDWPESVKAMQRNWIGRSQGASVRFGVAGSAAPIEVFTTRPDTLFGATYLVLAPEHPLVDAILPAAWPQPGTGEELDGRWTGGAETPADAVVGYRSVVASRSDLERQEARDKTGVFTGAWATNPVNGEPLPVFVADYVLMGYGTGAIMAVPGQDQRDWDFATVFGLPIKRTVQPPEDFDGEAYTGAGAAINSANSEVSLDGLGVDEAKSTIIAWLAERGDGEAVVQYKLRDWLFSRQRYWGEPFPVAYAAEGETDGGPSIPRALPDSDLPVLLPDVDEYAPKTFAPDDRDSAPESPLARAGEWVAFGEDLASDPERGWADYVRETNTMPQWAGSCWYHLRYLDPTNTERFVDPDVERFWLGPRPEVFGAGDPGGVDLYVGGVEHAVLHLLYARFWQKVMFDLGHVSSSEPFRRLFNQGYIQAWAYTDARGVYVPAEEVVEAEGGGFTWNGEPVSREYGKMGKSLRNVVTPDEMCATYGADTFRLYEMSTGPMEASRPWSTRDVVGSQRFLQRVWRLLVDEQDGSLRVSSAEPGDETLRLLHRTIDGVRTDFPALHYNTGAAKLIELSNHLTKTYPDGGCPRSVTEPLVLMLAPLCPHLAEELWSKLGHPTSLAYADFPVADASLLVEESVVYPIQVKGKVRSRITVPTTASEDEIRAAALADEKIAEILGGAEPKKVIVVPGRLVNVVP
ncbi:leucine--tRNA ligase [Actinomycetospora termitidis]|uniref:Leucine--tRNA ligase n=1 Tax=Actinomycetospora termitidis TaxID=3053470 RepID=A0ABT7M522_9PSEU|nr:class I tRNA ligase family protein [Actinomycetospora sp. Odt1-22]MDL5154877.1 class I tRNA ligase family protein [Actinomycetospora sp. Odt1-22]